MKNVRENKIKLAFCKLFEQKHKKHSEDLKELEMKMDKEALECLQERKIKLRNELVRLFDIDQEYAQTAIELKDVETQIELLKSKI